MGFSFELTYSVCSTFWVDYLLKLKPFLFSDSDYMDTAKTLHYSAFSASSAGDKISLKSKTPHPYK